MLLNNYFLDFSHTVGGGVGSAYSGILSLNPTPTPNNLIYFLGLLIALLTQVIVIYDYLFNFVICSPYLVFSKDANIRYLLDKFSLGIVDSSFIDKVFWPISLFFLISELILCYIFFTFFHISLLWLSIIVWFFSVLFSLFSLIFISKYIHDLDDIKRAVRIRDSEKIKLELRIAQLKPLWRVEEMNKHGDDFTESLLEKRVDEYRTVHLTAINEFLTTDNLFIIEEAEDPGVDIFEGNVWEWLEVPTHYNLINVIMYGYYILICCQDSVYLYNAIYPNISSIPRTDELSNIDTIFFTTETSNIISWFIRDYLILFSFYF